MPALTPKLRDALQCAAGAPNYTLTRCRAGFRRAGQPSAVVTRRTANHLVNDGLAAFDDPELPSTLELTGDGVAFASAHHLIPAQAAA